MHISKSILASLLLFAVLCVFAGAYLSGAPGGVPVVSFRAEFAIFVITLLGVAMFHHHTFYVAVAGLASVLAMKLLFAEGFSLSAHLHHEWHGLTNLFGLLLGFSVLAKHFEESHIPEALPRFLPNDWKGGFVLLTIVLVLSAFLDNIAAAMIGGAIALTVFKGKVDIGYCAAIVAASNAGGAGSVVGDTTTTMMWIDGVAASDVLHAYVAVVPAFLIFAVIASIKQHKYQPIQKDTETPHPIEWKRLAVVVLILIGAISTNIGLDFPAIGVWGAILIGAIFCKTPWGEIGVAMKGTLFLISLVLCASMMPVDQLPPASWQSSMALGFVSSVFDNIPLTKLALSQGGYDWGVLAFAVGFGGSMIWFGSSAGVALTNIYPHARSVGAWIKHGWSIPVAYAIGFLIMIAVWGWEPHEPHKEAPTAGAQQESTHAPAH